MADGSTTEKAEPEMGIQKINTEQHLTTLKHDYATGLRFAAAEMYRKADELAFGVSTGHLTPEEDALITNYFEKAGRLSEIADRIDSSPLREWRTVPKHYRVQFAAELGALAAECLKEAQEVSAGKGRLTDEEQHIIVELSGMAFQYSRLAEDLTNTLGDELGGVL